MTEEKECNKCESTNLKFVKYQMKNKIKILRKQCFDCGYLNPLNYKRNLVSDFDSLIDMDLDFRIKQKEKQLEKYNIKTILFNYSQNHFERQKKYYRDVYLQSEEWKYKRNLIMEYYNYKCQKCNADAIDLHHLTYDNVFKEKFQDLLPLCRGCHKKEHEI